MVRFARLGAGLGAEVIGKLEAYNPAGSVKDRIGVAMIEAAEAEGRIEPGRTTVVESTSGNTGIALAFVCAAKGYRLVVTMPQGMSRERAALLRLYGAEVILVTESMGGMHEAVDEADRIARADARTRSSRSSSRTRPTRRCTAARRPRRSGRDLDGDVDVFVAGVGTGGTITGVGEVLKERKPDVHVVAVEPASSPVLSGGRPGPHRIQGIGAGFVPEILNRDGDRRDRDGRGRGRDRDGAGARAPRGRLRRDLRRARRPGRRSRSAPRPELDGKRIVVDDPGLRRALHLDALLRALRSSPEAACRVAYPLVVTTELSDSERERYRPDRGRARLEGQIAPEAGPRDRDRGRRGRARPRPPSSPRAALGYVAVVDGGTVALRDLAGQAIYYTPDVGKGKADTLAAKLGMLNPDGAGRELPGRADAENAGAIVEGHDVVLDCTPDADVARRVAAACRTIGSRLQRARRRRVRGGRGRDAGHRGVAMLVARPSREAHA